MNRTFMVKVIFHPHARKIVPAAGYRPHIVIEDDTEREYLGVEFYDIEVDCLGRNGYAMCSCLYESEGVNYQKI